MSERAYVQPSVSIGVLKYINPNKEDIVSTKTLTHLDSPIQLLNPQGIDTQVDLADPTLCEGMMVWLINDTDSTAVGSIEVYDPSVSSTEILVTIVPATMAHFMCISGKWYVFGGSVNIENGSTVNGGTGGGGTGGTGDTPWTNPTNYHTKTEVDSMFANMTFDGTAGPIGATGSLDYYTKTEIDSMFDNIIYAGGGFAGTTGPIGSAGAAEYYTKAELVDLFANKTYVNDGTGDTPWTNPTNYHTKTEVDSMFANMTFDGTAGPIGATGSLDYYTKTEIDSMFDNIIYAGGGFAGTTGPIGSAGAAEYYTKAELVDLFANKTYL